MKGRLATSKLILGRDECAQMALTSVFGLHSLRVQSNNAPVAHGMLLSSPIDIQRAMTLCCEGVRTNDKSI